MPNGSLYDILHSNSLRPLHWAKRVRFALQIARAVDALHSANPPVIHRDIKSSNVLIDGNWNARLGDFGLALRGYVEDVRIKCTPPAGTLGYLDPGYIAPEDLTAKSDVFSFGILLLEIVSGRNAIDMNYSPPSVVDWALPLIKHGEFVALCDPRIDPPDDLLVIQQLAMLAAKCVRSMAEKRPAMAEVVECLRIVNKSMSSPLWNSFRKQPVEELSLSIKEEMCDAGEEVVKTENHGYRTGSVRNRKVSSILLSLSVDFGKEITNKRVGVRFGRSNSIGSSSEIKLGSDAGLANNQLSLALVRRRSTVAVKMPYVKLYKSRSLGVLRSTCLDHSSERGFVLQLVKSPKLKGLDLSRLVISVDNTLETNIIEPKQST
ncbi:Serine/threonine-protein kinase-like protein [Thalictrum thalictroides]|uniref:Serine/threonine-protein kinase-like protein n=1 Tax=Thalictrum thalictroides TaxID=46969 RepID=A0A7J6XCE0_THATH|nr:Serine/threonine-protein kinase-like protein [Thalictrum thalictroides]